MVSHKLVPYWFRLHEAYYTDDDDYWSLSSLSDQWEEFEQDSIIDVLGDFSEQYSDTDEDDYENDGQGKTFEVDRYEKDSNIVEGEIKLGQYGIEADVYDTEEHERLYSHRKPHHSEETPFYFFFYLPPNYDTRAVAIFKEYKGRGVKSELFSRLQDYLSEFNPDDDDDERNNISAEMKPVYTEDADQRLHEADAFKKLKFEGKQELTPIEEHADNEGEIDVDRQTVSRVDVIRPVRNGRWSSELIKSFGPDEQWKYGELDKEEYQDVKVEIEVDGSAMTFSLWHTDIRMRRNLDPSRLTMDGGHPTAESLSPKARGIANAVLPPEVDEPDDGTLL